MSRYAGSRAARQNLYIRFYTYVLVSSKNGDIYIGSTEDLNNRVDLHNQGKVKSIKGYRPWKLLEYREFESRSEAVRYEKFLKNHQQKEMLKEKYKAS